MLHWILLCDKCNSLYEWLHDVPQIQFVTWSSLWYDFTNCDMMTNVILYMNGYMMFQIQFVTWSSLLYDFANCDMMYLRVFISLWHDARWVRHFVTWYDIVLEEDLEYKLLIKFTLKMNVKEWIRTVSIKVCFY